MPDSKFLAVCLNPVIQNTLVFDRVAPGEVNRTALYRVDASGKGVNVARVLGQLGRGAAPFSQLGGPTREWFLAMCEADGLSVHWAESGSDIRVCTTVIDRSARSATELVQEARPVGPGTAERLLAEYARVLPLYDAVVFSGTKAAGLPRDTIPSMARAAVDAGKRLFLDLKGDDLLACLPFRPVVVKPNLEELLQTYARDGVGAPAAGPGAGADESEGALRDFVASRGREFFDEYGACLVVTRGSRPTWYWDGHVLGESPARGIQALNPIGSGDSFMAGLASASMDGATLAEAVEEGTRLGALNAERLKPGSIS